MTRSLLDEACPCCKHQPLDVSPGCPCHHAPCIHDHNVTVAANAEAATVEAIAAWLEDWATGLSIPDRELLRLAAEGVRDGDWRRP